VELLNISNNSNLQTDKNSNWSPKGHRLGNGWEQDREEVNVVKPNPSSS
jgi:hypothetical protein